MKLHLRLYLKLCHMEFYKLWHRKAFMIGSMFMILTMLFYFQVAIAGGEISTVNGVKYYGKEAVKVNRRITEPYRGELTDQKAEQIIAEYGFPSVVEYDYPGWRDANYLNGFVTKYLSDGSYSSWDDYTVPTRLYAIKDTVAGELEKALGGRVPFAYTRGWEAFLDVLQTGMVLASILLIMAVSIVFAEESQTKMLPLAFTTQEGKGKVVWAKITAGFILTIVVYGTVVLSAIVPSAIVFGLDGGNCPLSMALDKNLRTGHVFKMDWMPVQTFAGIVLGAGLLAMLLLSALTMCVSAHCKSNFGAVAAAAAVWGMPLLIQITCGGLGYFLTSCMPMLLVMTDVVYELILWERVGLVVAVDLPLLILCVEESCRIYKGSRE